MTRLDDRAREFLDAHRVGHLATADAGGNPTVVPVCYALVGDAIWTPIDAKPKRAGPAELRRVRNVLARAEVSLVIDDYDDDWSRLAHLIVWGTATVVGPGGAGHVEAVARLRDRYAQYRAMPINALPAIRIVPDRARFWSMGPDAWR